MNAKEVVKSALESTQKLMLWFLSDLNDEEILKRPVDGANHIAWQLGHVISSEVGLVKETLPDAQYPELPAGFKERHSNDTAKTEPPTGFGKKQDYEELFTKVRTATVAVVEKLSDADFDKPTQGSMAAFAPRVGDLFVLVANHTLMHAGQFTVLRRKLEKPILF